MDEAGTPTRYLVCEVCGYHMPVSVHVRATIICDRCGSRNTRLNPKSTKLTAAFSFTALILYLPANFFPFMTLEIYGNRTTSTIWSGIVQLSDTGYWPIAIIVFLASILIPLMKLIILFYLSATAKNNQNPRFKTTLYHIVEAIGRWSMLDIFLLAVLVAVMKLGNLAEVRPEAGSIMFLLVVIFTMLASAYFDPQMLWERESDD